MQCARQVIVALKLAHLPLDYEEPRRHIGLSEKGTIERVSPDAVLRHNDPCPARIRCASQERGSCVCDPLTQYLVPFCAATGTDNSDISPRAGKNAATVAGVQRGEPEVDRIGG